MKTTYKKKISKKEIWITGVAALVAIIMSVASLLFSNKSSSIFYAVWLLLYTIVFSYFYIKSPAAYINYKNNRLVTGGHYINIPHILSLEEREKKGLGIRYLYNNMERLTLIRSISDIDKPRLLADLSQINPNIVIK